MTTSPTRYVTSADGTRIAYDTNGSGPAVSSSKVPSATARWVSPRPCVTRSAPS